MNLLGRNFVEMEIKKLIKQYERRLDRNRKKESDLESRKEKLSCHGYWSLGYFSGLTYVYETIIDDLKGLIKK